MGAKEQEESGTGEVSRSTTLQHVCSVQGTRVLCTAEQPPAPCTPGPRVRGWGVLGHKQVPRNRGEWAGRSLMEEQGEPLGAGSGHRFMPAPISHAPVHRFLLGA